MEDKIKSVIEKIRPALQADGGDIEYVGFDDGIVKVRLTGACGHCPHAIYTLKLGVEHAIVEEVPQVKEVQAVE
ncbi:MAG: NifU family protein [Candidatus Woesearchaeota archaeon]